MNPFTMYDFSVVQQRILFGLHEHRQLSKSQLRRKFFTNLTAEAIDIEVTGLEKIGYLKLLRRITPGAKKATTYIRLTDKGTKWAKRWHAKAAELN